MPFCAHYLGEEDCALLRDATRTAAASLYYAIRLYLMLALTGTVLLLPFLFYGLGFMLNILLVTRNTVLFLFLPLFVLTPPRSIFWKYFLAVPVVCGLGNWIIAPTVPPGPDRTFNIYANLLFLIILCFSACIVNRRRSNQARKGDPVIRSVIALTLLIVLFFIFRRVFPIAGETILVAVPGVVYSWFIFALIGAGIWIVWRAATKLR